MWAFWTVNACKPHVDCLFGQLESLAPKRDGQQSKSEWNVHDAQIVCIVDRHDFGIDGFPLLEIFQRNVSSRAKSIVMAHHVANMS